MHVNLTLQMEKFLQGKVRSGLYSNASEVVRDAIRRMSEEDKKLEALRAAVRKGEKQINNGESPLYTPELLKAITEEAFVNAKRGKKPKADVLP